MTQPVVHLWRLLKWGRTLARHGALRGSSAIQYARARAAAGACRAVRRARARQAAYADAFQAIGPAAIKLGQTLATRPDLVGDEPHMICSAFRTSCPRPLRDDRRRDGGEHGRPPSHFFASIEEEPVGAASIAQVHRAVTTDGRTVAVKVLRPGVEEDFARAIDTYQWAAAQVEGMSGEAARLRPRLTVENFRRWTLRELNFRREAASASELPRR